MAKRKVTTFKLEEEMLSKLQKANIKTVEDIMHHSFLQLMTSLRLSSAETEKLIQDLTAACVPTPCTAYSHLERARQGTIPLGDSSLDRVLQGGITEGTLTEFTGPPGVGKTQMCLHLAVKCLLRNGPRNSVCCIDTEGAFRPHRLLQLLRCSDEAKHREDELAAKFHLMQPNTIQQFKEILDSLEMFCVEKEIGLVLVDSVASLLRKELNSRDGNIERAALLASWAAHLKQLAHTLQIAVVATNHVTSRMSREDLPIDEGAGSEQQKEDNEGGLRFFTCPALGTAWTHFVNTRMILQFHQHDTRQVVVAKSSVAPSITKNFVITSSGIEFVGEMKEAHPKNPVEYRIKEQPGFA